VLGHGERAATPLTSEPSSCPVQLFRTAYVQPISFDRERTDRNAVFDAMLEQGRNRILLIYRNPGERRRRQYVNSCVYLAGDHRFLVNRDEPVAVHFDGPERDLKRVRSHTDSRLESAIVVKVEHTADIALRHEVPVQYHYGMFGDRGEQPQRATRAERTIFSQVIDAAAELRAIAKMLFDYMCKIVHGNVELPYSSAHQVQYQPLENWSTSDGYHRFRDLMRERCQARATAASKQDGRIRTLGPGNQAADGVKTGESAVLIQYRHLPDPTRTHQVQYFCAPGRWGHRDKLTTHDIFGRRGMQRRPTQ